MTRKPYDQGIANAQARVRVKLSESRLRPIMTQEKQTTSRIEAGRDKKEEGKRVIRKSCIIQVAEGLG